LCGVRRQRFSVLLCLGRLRGRYGTIDKGPQVGRYASALRRSFYQVSNKHFIYIYLSLSFKYIEIDWDKLAKGPGWIVRCCSLSLMDLAQHRSSSFSARIKKLGPKVLNHPDHPDVIPVTLDLLRRSTDSEALFGTSEELQLGVFLGLVFWNRGSTGPEVRTAQEEWILYNIWIL
jgi:hypothetical protein